MLVMSQVAVYLFITILFILLLTTVAIMTFKNRGFEPLLRPIQSFADVAVLVASSDWYLELLERR